MTRQRRRAVTLIELLFASAILSAVLLGAYSFLQQGFRDGVGVLRRETADLLSRNALERFGSLSPENLEAALGGRGELEVNTREDMTLAMGDPRSAEELERIGYHRGISFDRLPGVAGAGLLRTEVRWGSGRSQRRVGHSRFVFGGGVGSPGGEGSAGKSSTDFPEGGEARGDVRPQRLPAGLSRAAEVPDWGKSTRWGPDGQSDGSQLDPGAAEAPPPPTSTLRPRSTESGHGGGPGGGVGGGVGGTASAGSGGLADRVGAAARGVRFTAFPRAGAGGGGAPASAEGYQQVRWGDYRLGEPGLVQRYLGPDGELGRGAPPEGPPGEAEREQQVQGFLARTGLPDLESIGDGRLTPGRYRYRLEALDLGEQQVLGVYLLRRGRAEAVLVQRRSRAGQGKLGGDPVLAGEALTASRNGKRYRLWRTEERLYLVQLGGRFPIGWLEVAEVPLPDATPEGTKTTRELLAAFREKRGLVADQGSPVEPLEQALGHQQRLAREREPVTRVEVLTAEQVDQRRDQAEEPAPGERARMRETWRRALELALKDPPEALKALSGLLRGRPSHREGRALKGRVLAAMGRLEEAVENLEVAAAYRRAPPAVIADYASLLLRSRRFETAALAAERLRWESPGHRELAPLEAALLALEEGDTSDVRYLGGPPPRVIPGERHEGVILSWVILDPR